ncbi:MAG TPA: phosphoribosylformylglycinamidine cyclo-ligase [Solirubrobacteraceae bacterium]|jgi:phosphoribosylformylglycinamidine cyclo-ligase|nr:phosphoribosylformylglycinamidine cyclo-ligase [Solirubrobacteraceae bacterium]
MPEDAYAAAGVSIASSDAGVRALVDVLRTIDPGRESRSLLGSGHYASVLRVAPDLAIALCTDGVGSKLVVAEQTGRLDTVGIDCIAMNVNDLICVGAEPIAMLDYLAVEQPDPAALAQIARGLKAGAELAGIEIPGGELAVLPELIRGHPSPHGFDLCGAAFGTVAPDALVTGATIAPGQVVIGLPSSGLHSNGYTLARRALLEQGGLTLDDAPPELRGATVADALLEPTVIYVRAILELLASDTRVHGLAHITGGGLANLLRLNERVGFAIDAPLPVPAVFDLIARCGGVPEGEMWDVFNMGCGFVAVVGEADDEAATALLDLHHPGAARIGRITDRAGTIERG